MTESSHPLPWMIGPVGDKHVVKDRDGELVYIGTDVGEVMRLYRLAVEVANDLPARDAP